MSAAAANAAIDRMEADSAFADRVKNAGGREGSLEILKGEGFDVTPDDMRDALLDRYGEKMSQEQLDQLAGGIDQELNSAIAYAALGGVAAAGAAAIV